MDTSFSPKDRMLSALNYEKPDRIPLTFMIFTALKERLKLTHNGYDPLDLIKAQVELGLDAFVDLRTFSPENKKIGHSDASGFPVRFDGKVNLYEWADISDEHKNPILYKKYETPAGNLSVAVSQTSDWPYGDARRGKFKVPFMDDYLAPRSEKYLIEDGSELEALKYLLGSPGEEDIETCRLAWDRGKRYAERNGLLLAGGWGVGGDALAWFCGLQNSVIMALEKPDLLKDILRMIQNWNIKRMEVYLDYGIDLFIRRAWYEGTDFWSPDLYRQLFAPVIREEVRLAHQAGSKYGYILTSGSAPLHDLLIDLGIDVLIGIDPVQGKGTDLSLIKQDLDTKICSWGGVNGFITIERGTHLEIEKAVQEAIEILGPAGFILSPVDNVRDPSDIVWDNVLHFITSWRNHCKIH